MRAAVKVAPAVKKHAAPARVGTAAAMKLQFATRGRDPARPVDQPTQKCRFASAVLPCARDGRFGHHGLRRGMSTDSGDGLLQMNVRNGVATLTLNDNKKRNALSSQVLGFTSSP